jgi:hypothetical protein
MSLPVLSDGTPRYEAGMLVFDTGLRRLDPINSLLPGPPRYKALVLGQHGRFVWTDAAALGEVA